MQDTIRKKRGAIGSAIAVVLLLLSYLGVYFLMMSLVGFEPVIVGVLVVYGIIVVVGIICILCATKQRLKELDSGEEEEAKKY